MKPVRVGIVCEGQTEVAFVRTLLGPAFPQLLLQPFLPGHRGGDIKFDRVLPDILRTLKSDPDCRCTTFFDYYRRGKFPMLAEPKGDSPQARAERIEGALREAVESKLGPSFRQDRFRPYVSMHEFEGLLFSDPARLAEALGSPGLHARLTAIRDGVETPEHIDDGPETAPSKRLLALGMRPKYDKISSGMIAAKKVGIDAMREACPHFRSWLEWFDEIARAVGSSPSCRP